MNVRYGRILMLLAVVSAAAPAKVDAADRSGPEFIAPTKSAPSTPAEKAVEARRLAEQAAALSQRAAELAAESQAEKAAASTQKNVSVVTQSTPWATRGAAEVLISDADSASPVTSTPAESPETNAALGAVPSIGWRSHRTVPKGAIRFSDPSVPATTAAAAPATRPAAIPIAAYAPIAATSDGFELKLTEAALAAQASTETSTTSTVASAPAPAPAPVVQQVAVAPAPVAAAAAPVVSVEPQSIQEPGIRLASKIADTKVKTADSEEPIPPPAPAPPYSDERALQSTDGVPCDCLEGECCGPRPLFWTSGIEATFLRPDLNNGYASFAAAEFADDRFDEFSTSTDDVDDFYMAPRIWFGVQGCLWGANVRYWHLRANEGSFDPTLGSNGQWDGPNCGTPDFGFTSCNDLEAYTVDLEVTRRVCLNDCWMQFSGGVRHAEIEQDASLIATALADDSVLFGFAGGHRQTRGTGIVLGWYGRKPIFPCSCVHWFYNFHWSALWGPTETAAETGVLVSLTSQDPDAVAAAGSVNGASTAVDDNLFIGEIQLGLEWDYALRCMPANAFCRVALEYQRWTGGMGYSAANSFAGVEIDNDPTTLGDALAFADAPELDLVGLAISTGLTW